MQLAADRFDRVSEADQSGAPPGIGSADSVIINRQVEGANGGLRANRRRQYVNVLA
ncbi:hypothetical protein [Mycobacterium sp.]|uniref:hypothetical protein n=1 Tax=Mycobacterium sp. TaxID=1785 RepID=UPI002BF0AC1D|nr:hypothetical protein [Mycobacterium sp.]HTQ19054.1 hypothetical protein [Mycobacterium sp.]